jgi:sugar/nucleoside kinase (ribokinase family)
LRVLIIGEPCIDVIHKADGTVYNEHGGISYSVTASCLLHDGIETIPVIGLGREDRPYFYDLFVQLNGLDLSAVYESSLPTRRVDLFYEDENKRWECSTQPIEPTPFERIEPFLAADGIHINLISGWDITLETLGRIRAAAPNCHIHIDLHNIVMQHFPDGKRVRGPRLDYLDWCNYADTVQLNEDEANVIDPASHDHRELAKKILGTEAAAVVVSLAEKGLLLYEKTSGNIKEHFFPPRQTAVIDPTGSGDVFGAAFLHSVLLGKNYVEAAAAGIEMAVHKLGVAGPVGLINLKRDAAHG